MGNQAWTNKLEWPGQKDFNKASIKNLTLDKGDAYGKVRACFLSSFYGAAFKGRCADLRPQIKHSGNLTFMQIFAAGHMVPMDQPENSLDFFNRYVS